ncbi:MAG: HypC/HybG/HupF family hydrogenase formation chaperone [Candidatus Omnitrophica bacterium]|nr:HypC/HybG/HupF family hydrogenase formation chaperone [Candidatus Omnitrophota bacterium]
MCLATPAKIKSINKLKAIVDFGGVTKEISLGVLSNVKKGDYVLIHAGFAIGKVKQQEAKDIKNALKELEDVFKYKD